MLNWKLNGKEREEFQVDFENAIHEMVSFKIKQTEEYIRNYILEEEQIDLFELLKRNQISEIKTILDKYELVMDERDIKVLYMRKKYTF